MGILKCVRVCGCAWTAGGTGLDDVAKSGAIETAIEGRGDASNWTGVKQS